MNDTTHRHPRTLVEAFGCYGDHACPVIKYQRPLQERVADVLLAVVIGIGIAALLFFGASS